MHDQYIESWNEAMESGDTSALEVMGEHYYAAFFNGAEDQPHLYSKDEAILGMQQSVAQLLGAKKKFNNRVIRLKDEENAIVFNELVIEKEANILASLFSIEYWQYCHKKWILTSEIEQPI